ncbi:unnamed protein product [Fusarium graminearum]|uniref:Uncharacterized protein n=1 Tax=Gibberella zeae TaxID=5518 RepID=A0A4E9EDV5_GIBZA|nr:unnamed protein product [Fusarium graminearum]
MNGPTQRIELHKSTATLALRIGARFRVMRHRRFDALNIPCILSLSFSLLLVPVPILSIMDLTVLLKLAPDSAPM